MIEKMKKLTFLVTDSERTAFIDQLRGLGVVHVVELQNGSTSPDLQAALAENERIKQAFNVIENITPASAKGKKTDVDSSNILDRVFTLQEEKNALQLQLATATHAADMIRPFGQFCMEKVHEVERQTGLKMNFFVCANKMYSTAWEDDYFAVVVAKDKKDTWFVTLSEHTPELSLTPITLPDNDLAYYEQAIADINIRVQANADALSCIAQYGREILEKLKSENESKLSLARVRLSSEVLADGVLHLMEGWVPAENADAVCQSLDVSHIFYELEAPKDEDLVPIKFRNDAFSHIYECITKMYGFPCYQEWDPTLIVAPFFTLFFAICMGDAGYGLLIMAYGIAEMRGKAHNVPILGEMLEGCGTIITSLGVATIVIGLLLGSFFGMDLVNIGWVPADSGYGELITWINGYVPGTNYSIKMAAALVIGVFHICLAMVVKGVMFSQRYGFKSQLSVWGWIVLIIGGVITGMLALTNTLSEETTKVVLITIAVVSGLCIFILNDLKRNPLINIGAGLYDTYNMASGLLGDVLSYLRLYALCLAGGMLGGAFNTMGNMVADLADGLPVYVAVLLWIFAIVIYIFGHVFNLLMSSISAFVHPLRLIFVEYFKNSGYEGKGIEYKPFK